MSPSEGSHDVLDYVEKLKSGGSHSRPEAPAHKLDEHLAAKHQSKDVVDALEDERVPRHLEIGERCHVVACQRIYGNERVGQ